MRKCCLVLWAAFAAGLATTGPLLAAAPANDEFANRETLHGNASVTGSNVDATAEPGEPAFPATVQPINSIWYSWTAPSCGMLEISTAGSAIDTTLAAYTGASVPLLELIADNDDAVGLQSRVEFLVEAGQVVQIAVDGFEDHTGAISLSVMLTPDATPCPLPDTLDLTDAGFTDIGIPDAPGGGILPAVAMLRNTGPTGTDVTLINARGAHSLRTIEFFNPRWHPVALSTITDANADGTPDDPALAVLAYRPDTGAIRVQLRNVADGSQLRTNMRFFGRNWRALDVAVVNDLDGNGVTGDTAVAVLAQNLNDGRYVVAVTPVAAPDDEPIFKERFFTPEWDAIALEASPIPGGSDRLINVLAYDPVGDESRIIRRRVSDGERYADMFAFGATYTPLDIGIGHDLDGNGVDDDTVVTILGINRNSMSNVVRSRRVKTNAIAGQGVILGSLYSAHRMAVVPEVYGQTIQAGPDAVTIATRQSNGLFYLGATDVTGANSYLGGWLD